MIDNSPTRCLDVFGATVISRRHRILCYLGITDLCNYRRVIGELPKWERIGSDKFVKHVPSEISWSLIGGKLEKAEVEQPEGR
ncbi:hypothetical protein Tco_0438539 [Tanacetum coccineum]